MNIGVPDAVLNTTGFFGDLHLLVTDYEEAPHIRRDVFGYRGSVFSTEEFVGKNIKLTHDIRDVTKITDIHAGIAERECHTSPEGIVIVRNSVCLFLINFSSSELTEIFSKKLLLYIFLI